VQLIDAWIRVFNENIEFEKPHVAHSRIDVISLICSLPSYSNSSWTSFWRNWANAENGKYTPLCRLTLAHFGLQIAIRYPLGTIL
jgi:hypothetical protein